MESILRNFENEHWEKLANDELEEWEHYKEDEKLKQKLKINIMEKQKVKIIQSVKEWGGQNGTVYYHNLEMENGDKINIGKKKQLSIGDELEYEIVDQDGTSEYHKAKTPKPENNSGGGKNDDYVKGIEVGHAINNAVNLACAGVELDTVAHLGCKTAEEKIYETAKVIMMISERLKSEK